MIESRVADTILDVPVEVSIDIAPGNFIEKWLQKLKLKPVKKTFYIKGATLRTMIRISKVLLSLNVKPLPEDSIFLDFSYKAIEQDGERLAQVIAIAIHNQKSEVPESLVNTILDNMTASDLKTISAIIVEKLNVIDFISTIASVRSISLMEASRDTQEEIIASGQ